MAGVGGSGPTFGGAGGLIPLPLPPLFALRAACSSGDISAQNLKVDAGLDGPGMANVPGGVYGVA